MGLIPQNGIVMWLGTNASIPAGFTRETTLDGKHIKGASTGANPGTSGGYASHSHSSTNTHSHTMNSHDHYGFLNYSYEELPDASDGSGSEAIPGSHFHSNTFTAVSGGGLSSTNVTYTSADNDPQFVHVIYIKAVASAQVPADVSLFTAVSVPAGYSNDYDLSWCFPKGAGTGLDGGDYGGGSEDMPYGHIHDLSHSHSETPHTHTGHTATTDAPGGFNRASSGEDALAAHTHSLTLLSNTSGSIDSPTEYFDEILPPYNMLMPIKNTSGSAKDPGEGMIIMWLGTLATIPAGWVLCDGANGTPDMRDRFVLPAEEIETIGTTGGTTTHTHTQSHRHISLSGHTHTGGTIGYVGTGESQHFGAGVWAWGSGDRPLQNHDATDHTWFSVGSYLAFWSYSSVSSDSADHQPPYVTVAFLQKQPITQTMTAKADIVSKIRTMEAKASVYQQVNRPGMTAFAAILPPQLFLDEVEKTVRQMSPKLEVQWDGVTWTDESIYYLTGGGNEKTADEDGQGIASTADIEVDNTDERFTPDNTTSPLYGYIKPHVPVRISITMGGYSERLFTGYIKNVHPDTKSKICSFECFDNQAYVSNKRANGIVYADKRTDELLTILAGLINLTSDQYIFDIGSQTVNFGYFEDRDVWPIMGEIAVAERGRIFFDRYGLLKFWNKDKLHNRASTFTLTQNDWILDLDYSVAEHDIKNVVTVKAAPRAEDVLQVIWTNGDVEYLSPYNATLVWIPARSTQVAWIDFDDPHTEIISPVKNVDYTANTIANGTGGDLTESVEIHEFHDYGNAVQLTVGNLSDEDMYLTKFQIRGKPATVLNWIRTSATDDASIERYGRQEIEIENNFIGSESIALAIAQEELYRKKESLNLFRIDIMGVPYLLCGDVINIEYKAGSYKEYIIDELDWSLDTGGFKQTLTLTNPYNFPGIQTMNARGYVVGGRYTRRIDARGRIV
jgi:hypothetical protein